jgi:hypothetical protein
MKPFPISKISTIVLWICMMITTGIFIAFYSGIIGDPDNESINESGLILHWLYIIFIISLLTTLVFSFASFFSIKRKHSRSFRFSLVAIGVLTAILAGAYLSANGNPLSIPGYEGNENTFFWLKLTDMWLYSIYLLIGLTLAVLLAGIIWSYIKKTR